jgi:4-amino-4-deoxy-L-arabinose transferase-like glycosyltransferase
VTLREARGWRRRTAALARRRPELATAAVLTLLATAVGIAWLLRFRRGALVDRDEAAYLGAVWDDWTGVHQSGAVGLWHAWTMQAGFAPLVPLSAMPFQLLLGPHLLAAYAALDVWYGVLLVSTASVARRLVGSRWAVMAVVVVGCLPGVVDETRTFHFALPAAALLTAVIAALLASRRLLVTRWALAAGILAGLTLLSRSMMVALLPGALAGGALLVVASSTRRRSARNLALACVAAAGLAATWYGPNLGSIWTYLTTYGYGAASTEYGTAHVPWDPAWWTAVGLKAVRSEIWLPLAVVLVIGLASLVAVVLRDARPRSSGGAWHHSARVLDAAVCACVVLLGYLALSSSPNLGSDFALPLLPMVCCLAIAGLARGRFAFGRRGGAVALAAISAVVIATKSGVAAGFAPQAAVDVPLVGSVTVLDARGDIQRYAQTFGSGRPGSLELSALDHQWQIAAADLEARLVMYAHAKGRLAVICAATRDPFVSTNHLQLAAQYWWDAAPPLFAQLSPRPGGDSVATYREQLSAA